jgi:hypothetical protein
VLHVLYWVETCHSAYAPSGLGAVTERPEGAQEDALFHPAGAGPGRCLDKFGRWGLAKAGDALGGDNPRA